MKVKELIDYLKQLDQDLEIGVMDDNCELNVLGVYYGEGSYTLAGSYNNELEHSSGCEWRDFK